jgi:hypothetical protein
VEEQRNTRTQRHPQINSVTATTTVGSTNPPPAASPKFSSHRYCERRIFYSADPRDKLPTSHVLVQLGNAVSNATRNASSPTCATDAVGVRTPLTVSNRIASRLLENIFSGMSTRHGARFRQKFTLEDAIGSHACSLEANTRVTNGIPLGSSLFLPVHTVNCVQTLKASSS